MKFIRIFYCLLRVRACSEYANDQNILMKKIALIKNKGRAFSKIDLFHTDNITAKTISGKGEAYTSIGINKQALLQIYNSKPVNFELNPKT